MSDFKCNECERDFSSREALDHHNKDKHGIGGLQSKHELRQLKKQEREKQQDFVQKKIHRSKLIKRVAYLGIPVIILLSIAVAFISTQPPRSNSDSSNSDIPRTPIHWHPTLEVAIKGQVQTIPANLGTVGGHEPIHTHDTTGTLHYENNNPTSENMRLGYFFDRVWRKQFNSTCIMSYCNSDSGTVKMFVNGQENFEFDNYIPRDKDEIRIEFS